MTSMAEGLVCALIQPAGRHAAWQASTVGKAPRPMAVINLAHGLAIHPANVSGRVRHERGNYRLLSQFVSAGQVRQQFETAP